MSAFGEEGADAFEPVATHRPADVFEAAVLEHAREDGRRVPLFVESATIEVPEEPVERFRRRGHEGS